MSAGQDGETGLYGVVPDVLDAALPSGIQLSPLIPGSARLEDVPGGSLARLVMLAPPGTTERRYAVAWGLKALREGGAFTILAPKAKGGARLGDELRGFGCVVEETGRRHHRICEGTRPAGLTGIEEAIEAGGPRRIEPLGLWSQPGIFSWDRIDPGSALLIGHLPALSGRGADFGCGVGVLSRAVLASAKVAGLTAIDGDRRAVEAARRNLEDPRASVRWTDLRASAPGVSGLDFVVLNPPFHGPAGAEDRDLGRLFIRRAADALRPGGTLWLTANRHLPYEALLKDLFKTVVPVAGQGGYKVVQARR